MKLRTVSFIILFSVGVNIHARIPQEVLDNMGEFGLSTPSEEKQGHHKALKNKDTKTTAEPHFFTYLTPFLHAIDDPWVRGAAILSVILYVQYQHKKDREQLKEFQKST